MRPLIFNAMLPGAGPKASGEPPVEYDIIPNDLPAPTTIAGPATDSGLQPTGVALHFTEISYTDAYWQMHLGRDSSGNGGIKLEWQHEDQIGVYAWDGDSYELINNQFISYDNNNPQALRAYIADEGDHQIVVIERDGEVIGGKVIPSGTPMGTYIRIFTNFGGVATQMRYGPAAPKLGYTGLSYNIATKKLDASIVYATFTGGAQPTGWQYRIGADGTFLNWTLVTNPTAGVATLESAAEVDPDFMASIESVTTRQSNDFDDPVSRDQLFPDAFIQGLNNGPGFTNNILIVGGDVRYQVGGGVSNVSIRFTPPPETPDGNYYTDASGTAPLRWKATATGITGVNGGNEDFLRIFSEMNTLRPEQSGRYVTHLFPGLTFDNSSSLKVNTGTSVNLSNFAYDAVSGDLSYDVNAVGQVVLDFEIAAADIRNIAPSGELNFIRAIPDGQTYGFNSYSIDLLQDVSSVLRNLDVGPINGSIERGATELAFVARTSATMSLPYVQEFADLCDAATQVPWYQSSIQDDASAFSAAATILCGSAITSRHFWEVSNEIWNFGFPQQIKQSRMGGLRAGYGHYNVSDPAGSSYNSSAGAVPDDIRDGFGGYGQSYAPAFTDHGDGNVTANRLINAGEKYYFELANRGSSSGVYIADSNISASTVIDVVNNPAAGGISLYISNQACRFAATAWISVRYKVMMDASKAVYEAAGKEAPCIVVGGWGADDTWARDILLFDNLISHMDGHAVCVGLYQSSRGVGNASQFRDALLTSYTIEDRLDYYRNPDLASANAALKPKMRDGQVEGATRTAALYAGNVIYIYTLAKAHGVKIRVFNYEFGDEFKFEDWPDQASEHNPAGAGNWAGDYAIHQSAKISTGPNVGFYCAKQYVPAGTAITNTTYWERLGGLDLLNRVYEVLGMYYLSTNRYDQWVAFAAGLAASGGVCCIYSKGPSPVSPNGAFGIVRYETNTETNPDDPDYNPGFAACKYNKETLVAA